MLTIPHIISFCFFFMVSICTLSAFIVHITQATNLRTFIILLALSIMGIVYFDPTINLGIPEAIAFVLSAVCAFYFLAKIMLSGKQEVVLQ
jgi:hypothetical protein